MKKNILCILKFHKWSEWYFTPIEEIKKKEYKISVIYRYKICERKNCGIEKKEILKWEKIENERIK